MAGTRTSQGAATQRISARSGMSSTRNDMAQGKRSARR